MARCARRTGCRPRLRAAGCALVAGCPTTSTTRRAMPDLHGWITQQIGKAQQQAERWHDLECATHDTTLIDATVLQGATLCDCGGPATVLRRCEADLRICNRHRLNPDAYWADAAMCDGCG